MPFTTLSDDATDDMWRLSDAAFRLHIEALVWSNRKLLDCRIEHSDLVRFSRNTESVSDSVSQLVSLGFWIDHGDHYEIQHNARFQRTRAAVLARQATNQKNGAKGGRPPKTPREQVTDSVTELVSESKTNVEGKGKDKGSLKASTTEVAAWPAVAAVGCTECQRTKGFGTTCPIHGSVSA